MAIAARYKGYRYPIEVIGHAVWLYHRFTLSLRDVEELMLARGVVVTYETIRSWCAKFGPDYAAQLRRWRPRPGDKWHLDEVFVKINGTTHYLWRAVDQHGDVLDILVQSRCNAVAATSIHGGVESAFPVKPPEASGVPLNVDLDTTLTVIAGARRYRAAAEGSDPPVAGSWRVGQRDWHTWKQALEVLLHVASRIRSVEDRFLRCGAVPPPPLPAVFEAKRRRHVYIGVRTRECAGGAHHEQPTGSGEGHRAISVRETRHSARQRYTRFTCLDWQASARVSDGPIVPVAAGLVRAKLRSVRMHEPFAACHHRSLSCRTRRSPKPPERVS